MKQMLKKNILSKAKKWNSEINDKPGLLMKINKNDLKICDSYQRKHAESGAIRIADKWSWIACGVIVVGYRMGCYWVIDGQHRVMAALKRTDIEDLPCVVFETNDEKIEASGFLAVNTARTTVKALDKYRVALTTNDEKALFVHRLLTELNIEVKISATKKNQVQCIGWLMNMASCGKKSRLNLKIVLELAQEVAGDDPIQLDMLKPLMHIQNSNQLSLEDKRLRERIIKVGQNSIASSARKACVFFGKRDPSTLTRGLFDAINKSLSNKFKFED